MHLHANQRLFLSTAKMATGKMEIVVRPVESFVCFVPVLQIASPVRRVINRNLALELIAHSAQSVANRALNCNAINALQITSLLIVIALISFNNVKL